MILERQPWHPISGSSELFINRNDDKTKHSWNKGTRSFVPTKSQKKDLCAIRGDATKLHLDPGRGESRKSSHISWQSYNFSCKILIFLGCVIGYIKITHSTYSLFTSASMQHSNWLSTFISIFSWFILNVGGSETIIWTKFLLSLHGSLHCATGESSTGFLLFLQMV